MLTREDLRTDLGTAPRLLDGGLATELESQGQDLHDPLWSAKLLLGEPQALVAAHQAYLEAGARCLCTASYQASRKGFVQRGLTPVEADDRLRDSVHLARQVARSRPGTWVAASLGSYGAVLHDGSEYTGRFDLDPAQLERFHAERAEALALADPDLFAAETIPSLQEAQVLARVLARFGRAGGWISLQARDGEQSGSGDSLEQIARHLDRCDAVVAVGVNCCAPQHVTRALASLRRGTDKPLLAYPNSGELWDASTQRWIGQGQSDFALEAWVEGGARLVGGCCRVGPGALAQLAGRLRAI